MGNFAENLNLGNRFRPPLPWTIPFNIIPKQSLTNRSANYDTQYEPASGTVHCTALYVSNEPVQCMAPAA